MSGDSVEAFVVSDKDARVSRVDVVVMIDHVVRVDLAGTLSLDSNEINPRQMKC